MSEDRHSQAVDDTATACPVSSLTMCVGQARWQHIPSTVHVDIYMLSFGCRLLLQIGHVEVHPNKTGNLLQLIVISALDSDRHNMQVNSLCVVISEWLNASQRRQAV